MCSQDILYSMSYHCKMHRPRIEAHFKMHSFISLTGDYKAKDLFMYGK